jgi:hypothetical protein
MLLPAATALTALLFAPAHAPSAWPLQAELLMAADAASFAPPDFKRQLAKHRERLMAGVRDAAAGDPGARSQAEHRAAAARGARAVAKMIREHTPFAEVAYQCGGVVHEMAQAHPPPGEAAAAGAVARSSSFLGYGPEPFADPERLAAPPPSALASPRAAFDTSVTLSTRLLAWIWKAGGGDASIVKKYPDSKGPFLVRE